jgi:CRP/FNR family transcriptional regulator, cyclic AMP receptor protein
MRAPHSIPDLLSGTRLFGSLDAPTRRAIAAEMREVHVEAGQSIFERGDPGSEIYLVLEGRVRLSVLTADGRELSFSHAVPHDIFGEIAVLDRSSRSASATAVGEVRLISLGAAAFHRALATSPALAQAAIALLCARLRDVSHHLEDVALFPIEVRLARYLLNRLALLAETTQKSMMKNTGTRLSLGMSQSELAMLLGASRPKVNAALIALEDAGAIRRVGQDMDCDAEVLGELALVERD